jgi:hypothetical protein
MRVQYTIPGLGPGPDLPEVTPAVQGPPTFKSRLRRLGAAIPRSWRKLAGLSDPPVNATLMSPPPRPPSLDAADPAEERVQWRNLLDRHSGALQNHDGVDSLDSTQRMMMLLTQYRELQDRAVVRHLSESGQ